MSAAPPPPPKRSHEETAGGGTAVVGGGSGIVGPPVPPPVPAAAAAHSHSSSSYKYPHPQQHEESSQPSSYPSIAPDYFPAPYEIPKRGDADRKSPLYPPQHGDENPNQVQNVTTAAAKPDEQKNVEKESQLPWKDSKDHHNRQKRYAEAPAAAAAADQWPAKPDPWRAPRVASQEPVAVGERDNVEHTHEAVGENKLDDQSKDRDRKRKDMKQQWGDRDKEKSDRREERDVDKWERERKDVTKDRERLKEREKDHVKREPWSGGEKEILHSEREAGEASLRVPEHENSASDPIKHKDFDNWKNTDREVKDRSKERDADTEGDRPEKRIRLYEKESDDGGADEGAAERELFNHGVQQRKRMLRPRGSPQMEICETHLSGRSQENEGSQEVSSVVYKVGECMQDLIKLWKEYESSQSDKNGESIQNGPTLEIRIPAEHVTATNRQVRGGQLWGTDIYTDDSDLVAVLMHTGYCRPTASPPPPAIQELRATIRILPPQDREINTHGMILSALGPSPHGFLKRPHSIRGYTSMLRNNVRSRAWGAGIGCSYRVEHCCIVKKGGGTIDLEPCLTHTSAVEPTLAPVAAERTMTTRAAASNALRLQRYVREVTIQYNLCNEPWIKYSISIVADKGLKKPLYTSARLKKGEVLYLETHSCRYELCFTGEKMVKATNPQIHEESDKLNNHQPHPSNGEKSDSDNVLIDVFRWSRCKKPLPQKVMRSLGIPLPLEYAEVLEENLDWEDVQWSQTGVWIAGKEYTLARVHFLSPT